MLKIIKERMELNNIYKYSALAWSSRLEAMEEIQRKIATKLTDSILYVSLRRSIASEGPVVRDIFSPSHSSNQSSHQ